MVMTVLGMRSQLESNPSQVFETLADINLYQSPEAESLVTQAAAGRRFCVEAAPAGGERDNRALYVRLCEDDYPGWLRLSDVEKVAVASVDDLDSRLDGPVNGPVNGLINGTADSPGDGPGEIAARLPKVVEFVQAALMTPNEYLWGGTVAPHYDCSGLMQAAFGSQGIWLPRDAYQQEAFLQALPVTVEALAAGDYSALALGDLVFFGTPQTLTQRATHVGLYVGEGCYIHSSGKAMGRNGIGVDRLTAAAEAPAVSRGYFELFRGAGRVVKPYRGGQDFVARKG